MANLFKPTYTKADSETGEKVRRQAKKWYGQYRDADGVLRRVPLSTDKTAAQAMLIDLVRKREQQQAGLIDPATDHLSRSIDAHVEDFRKHLSAKARSDSHISETIRLIQNVSSECKCRILADLQGCGDRLESYLSERRDAGASHRTINADLVAVRSFCRWLLGKSRMHKDPTKGLTRLNEDEDRRMERRAMTDEEAQLLVETTFHSERTFRQLKGEDRAIMYILALRTGLRRKELRSLMGNSFRLDDQPPTVNLAAAKSKRRKRDILPLPDDVAKLFRDYLSDRNCSELIWPSSWWRRSAEMIRLDLADAGIDSVDSDGHVIDFHGQRTTFVTGLARAGISPAIAQKLARHSDINLTMGTYTRLTVEELTAEVEKLPELRTSRPAESESDANVQSSIRSPEDTDLQKINDAWERLSQPIRQATLSIVEANR